MMIHFERKQSALEKRLRELQREENLVRDDIKTLARVLKKKEDLRDLPSLKTGKPPGPRAAAPESPAPEEERVKHRGKAFREVVRSQEPVDEVVMPYSARQSSNPRFTSYFSAGSIVPARPLRQEKSVQRNKAIFMLLFVLVVAFVVIRLVF